MIFLSKSNGTFFLSSYIASLANFFIQNSKLSCFRYKIKKELFVAAEGMYTGQFVYCGRKVSMFLRSILLTPEPILRAGSSLNFYGS